jgi:flagellar basal-body rod protein FlgB
MTLFGDTGFRLLEHTLDAAALRQRVIANNVANVDTPGFKRSDVQFEELLQQKLGERQAPLKGRRTDPRHFVINGIPPADPKFPVPQIKTDEHTMMNNNLNNVDIDYEMSLMAENQLRYNVLVQQANSEIKRVRSAVEGR